MMENKKDVSEEEKNKEKEFDEKVLDSLRKDDYKNDEKEKREIKESVNEINGYKDNDMKRKD